MNLYHVAFVYGSRPLRVEGLVHAQDAEAVREVCRREFGAISHFEHINLHPLPRFILTKGPHVCPN